MSIKRICEECNNTPLRGKQKHFCSRKCYNEAIAKGWNNQWAGKNHPCYGKPKPKAVREKISNSLMGKNNPNYGKPKSQVVLKKMREAQAKEKHWNWQGGITPLGNQMRNENEYKKWRTAVFERDNYTCQRCLKHGGYLNAHHIIPIAVALEEIYELSNGATVCVPCHDWIALHELS